MTHYLKASGIRHDYGGETLFTDVDLVLNPGDRVGLVGPNGAGKTTLLSILTGRIRPVSGQVTRSPGCRIGWSAEQPPDAGSQTVGGCLAAGLGEVAALAERMRVLEVAMAAGDQLVPAEAAPAEAAPAEAAPAEAVLAEAVLAEYGAAADRWTYLRGWTAQSRLAAVRDHLDLAHLADDAPLTTVSGGELARLTLAGLLLAEPHLLVLDEPTNHLDADGAAWLAGYLAGFPGAVLAVSHDRGFLDRAVSRIVELDGIHPGLQCYEGGYTAYRAEKARRWQRLLLSYEAQEKYRRRLAADVEVTKSYALATEQSTTNDRLRRYAKKVARKAKVRERRLERQVQLARWIAEPQTRPPLVLAFPAAGPGSGAEPGTAAGNGRAAATVLSARGLTVRAAGRTLLDDADLRLHAGDRVLVSGPNGAGKTTLLRALSGAITPDDGRVTAAHPPVLLPQDNTGLPPAASVLGYFRSRVAVYADDAERLLAGYLFGPDQWRTPLRALSAGEQRRLQLAVLVNGGSPILLLDEPTNYLDFDALDVVEEALRAYRGTLVIVTHDTYFADRIGCTRHWHVRHATLHAP